MSLKSRVLILGLLGTVSLLGACGPENQALESQGKIAKVGSALVRVDRLPRAEAEQICRDHYCEPNYIYRIDMGPKPKPEEEPSGSEKPGVGEFLDYSRKILNLSDAWKVTEGSSDIIVAVIDTGVDYTHEDLKNNIWKNIPEENGKPGVDDDNNGYVDDIYGWDFANDRPNAMDDHLHGTHCAGIIGAEKNKKGTVGVSPHVRIMPIKFLGKDGSGDTEAAIKAVHYATQNGARIISNSWGGGGYSKLLEDAIAAAQAKGVLVVAAAGNYTMNNDETPMYPASYPGVISVASTDEKDLLSNFSNFGMKGVLISAPGSRIYSSVLDNKYGTHSGTSMACPQVAGALALAMSAHPEWSPEMIKERLCATSKKILLTSSQCGRMDVAALLK